MNNVGCAIHLQFQQEGKESITDQEDNNGHSEAQEKLEILPTHS